MENKMSAGGGSAFGGRKIFFILTLAIFWFLPFLANANAAQIKIISAVQSIPTSTPSDVFTLEAQDSSGNKVNVSTTTRVSLDTSSASGQFLSASSSSCNTATTTSVTIANGTSHKSFCYIDDQPGIYVITVSVIDQPAVLGDSQQITILGSQITPSPEPSPAPAPSPEPLPVPSPSPEPSPTSTSPQVKSDLVKIYRFLPNPAGPDDGFEWVEIQNLDQQPVILDGWFLDDEGEQPANDAFELVGSIEVGEIKRFILPASGFALNNSGGDEVNLYFADQTLADKAVYTDTAYDDGVFELVNGVWQPPVQIPLPSPPSPTGGGGGLQTAAPSPKVESKPLEPLQIIISEILANPEDDDEEFIELFNSATTTAVLDASVLQIGARKKTFKHVSIPAQSFVVLYEDDLPVRLSNNGQTLKLTDSLGRLITAVSYPKALQGEAYASSDGKTYAWTQSSSPGKANEYVLGELTEAEEKISISKAKSTNTTGLSKNQINQLLQANEDLKLQIAVLQESINQLSNKLDNLQTQKEPTQIISQAKNRPITPIVRMILWPTALAILGGGTYFLFRRSKS